MSISQSPGYIAQLVMRLAAGKCLAADPGVASSIPAWSQNFMEINYEIISMVILLPLTDSRRVIASYKQKYLHEVLVKCFHVLFKLVQEKKCG